MMNTRKLTHLAMFVVLQIVVSRFLAIPTPIVKISFTYVPMAIAGYLYGWLFGGVAAALADVLGADALPTRGAYFSRFYLISDYYWRDVWIVEGCRLPLIRYCRDCAF
ncbi:folate family ECF transporter S component [Erysipelothrix piscisicarius]|uniref:folate family ECF transporter S component n=1 Tax=Erysipelothrix piscisicarius TaxID=2485784 RepID=UPI002F91EB22